MGFDRALRAVDRIWWLIVHGSDRIWWAGDRIRWSGDRIWWLIV